MNLGLFIIPIRFKNTKSYPFDYLDFCIKAENHGFSEVYIGEHITDDKEDIRSSMLFASALASRTKKLKICLSVLPLPHYNIDLLYSQLKDLNLLTEGRLKIGVGPGALNTDLEYMKININDRYKFFEENLKYLIYKLEEDSDSVNLRKNIFSTLLSKNPINSKKLKELDIGILSSNFSSRKNLKSHISCYSSNNISQEILKKWSICHNYIDENISEDSKLIILSSLKYIHKKLRHNASSVMGLKFDSDVENTKFEDYRELLPKKNASFDEYIRNLPINNNCPNHILNVFDCLDDTNYKKSILRIGEELGS